MFQIMLVDDDPTIRVKLKMMIADLVPECVVVAEARTGAEAVAMSKRMDTQIIITDIAMPDMNGVELIEYLRLQHSDTVVVALSAYDDFTYVRDSLKLGAFDYLLKHQVTPDILTSVLHKAMAQVAVSAVPAHTPEPLLPELLSGGRRCEEAIRRVQVAQTYVMAVGMFSQPLERIANAESILSETLNMYERITWMTFHEQKPIFLFCLRQGENEQLIHDILQQAQGNISRFVGVTLFLVVGRTFTDLHETPLRFSVILKALENARFVQDCTPILWYNDWNHQNECHPLTLEDERLLMFCIDRRDEKQIDDWLDKRFELAIYAGRPQLQLLSIDLVNLLSRALQASGLEAEEVFGEKAPFLRLQETCNAQEMKGCLLGWFSAFFHVISLTGGYESNELVKKAQDYIRLSYARGISLSDVAVHLSVSSAYLSRLFNRCTGFTVVKYINSLRMEEARGLIAAGRLSLKEVANQVGINNYNYFYLLYKKTYGVPPSIQK